MNQTSTFIKQACEESNPLAFAVALETTPVPTLAHAYTSQAFSCDFLQPPLRQPSFRQEICIVADLSRLAQHGLDSPSLAGGVPLREESSLGDWNRTSEPHTLSAVSCFQDTRSDQQPPTPRLFVYFVDFVEVFQVLTNANVSYSFVLLKPYHLLQD